MSNADDSVLSQYSSLADPHLRGYFNNSRLRRHLHRVGLIRRNGTVVDESTIRINLMQKTRQQHVREKIARTIMERTLDFESQRQFEIRKQLEIVAKSELVNRMRKSKYNGRLSKAYSRSGGYRARYSSHSGSDDGDDDDAADDRFMYTGMADVGLDTRHLTNLPSSALHNLHANCVDTPWAAKVWKEGAVVLDASRADRTPCPPAERRPPVRKADPPRPLKGLKPRKSAASRPSDRIEIEFRFYGKKSKVQRQLDSKDPHVSVEQQHCGGENITVFAGTLACGDLFVIASQRNPDFPLGLTFFIDGKEDCRLSACCEYKHKPGKRLGRNGYFGVAAIRGGKPCFKCQMESQDRTAPASRTQLPPPKEKKAAPSIREIPAKSLDDDSEHNDGDGGGGIDGVRPDEKQAFEIAIDDDEEGQPADYYDDDFHDSVDSGSSSESESESSCGGKKKDTHEIELVEDQNDAARDKSEPCDPSVAESVRAQAVPRSRDEQRDGPEIDVSSVDANSRPASAVRPTRKSGQKPPQQRRTFSSASSSAAARRSSRTVSPSPPPTPLAGPRRFSFSSDGGHSESGVSRSSVRPPTAARAERKPDPRRRVSLSSLASSSNGDQHEIDVASTSSNSRPASAVRLRRKWSKKVKTQSANE